MSTQPTYPEIVHGKDSITYIDKKNQTTSVKTTTNLGTMDKQQHRSKIEKSPQSGPIDQHKTTNNQMRNPIDNRILLTTGTPNRGTDLHTRYKQPHHITIDNEYGEDQNNPQYLGYDVPNTTTEGSWKDKYWGISHHHQSLRWRTVRNYLHNIPRTRMWVYIKKENILREQNHTNTTNHIITRQKVCCHCDSTEHPQHTCKANNRAMKYYDKRRIQRDAMQKGETPTIRIVGICDYCGSRNQIHRVCTVRVSDIKAGIIRFVHPEWGELTPNRQTLKSQEHYYVNERGERLTNCWGQPLCGYCGFKNHITPSCGYQQADVKEGIIRDFHPIRNIIPTTDSAQPGIYPMASISRPGKPTSSTTNNQTYGILY